MTPHEHKKTFWQQLNKRWIIISGFIISLAAVIVLFYSAFVFSMENVVNPYYDARFEQDFAKCHEIFAKTQRSNVLTNMKIMIYLEQLCTEEQIKNAEKKWEIDSTRFIR